MNAKTPLIRRDSEGHIHVSPALRHHLIGGMAVYAIFVAVFPISLWKSGHLVWPAANVQVAEAQAWLNGSLALPDRKWDTAVYEGRVYSHFPPLMTFLSVAVMALGLEGVPFNVLSVLFVLPIPGLAFVLFARRCGSVFGGVVLACAFVLGTSQFFVLCRTLQSGKTWQLNHAISQLGLLIFLIDYFGKKRIWPGGIGLIICTWSRLTMAVYLVPLLWAAFSGDGRKRRTGQIAAVVATLVSLAVPMTLNALKFGNPLNAGYALIYEGRDDVVAQDARIGLFSLRFVPRNLYAMNLGPPEWKQHQGQWRLVPSTQATGIWWTTPLLLYLFVDIRRIWNVEHRALLFAAVVIYCALMMFHTIGATQKGYNRFSLDFVLTLMAMIGPWAFEGKRRYVTPLLVLWGVAYFSFWVE